MKSDIEQRVKSDFPKNVNLVNKLLDGAELPERERVIRGILFLAEGDLDKFGDYLDLAKRDYRDLIMNAEFEYPSGERVRDFSESF